MTLILDLDHLLIRTESLKKRMFESVKALGISKAVWNHTYAATVKRARRRYSYNAGLHGEKIALVLRKPKLSARITSKLYAAVLETKDLVYKDAVKFLRRARTAGAAIILLTRGEAAWQNKKIKAARIRKFFDRVIITPEAKSSILKTRFRLVPPTYLITDNAEEIQKLRSLGIEIIQLIRRDGRYQRRARGVPVVYNLDQTWKIIKKT